MGTDSILQHGTLQQHILARFGEAKTNRAEMEKKWDWNDRVIDGEVQPWTHEPSEKNAFDSTLTYPLARQRTNAARTLASDSLFPKNAVPFSILCDDPDGAGTQAAKPSTLTLKQKIEGILKDIDAVNEFQTCFDLGCRYGDSYGHVYVGTDGRPCLESVPNRECYQDLRKESIQDGEYFFRRQALTRMETIEFFETMEFIDADALDNAVKDGSATASTDSQDGRDRLPASKPDCAVVECWIKVDIQKYREWLDGQQARNGLSEISEDEGKQRYIPILAYVVNDKLVGCVLFPGRVPYEMFIWDR